MIVAKQQFPAVRLVAKHGASIAWIVPAIIAIVGLLGFALQWNAWLAGGIVVGAAVLFCVLRVVVELVQIIAETLLPQ